jgi:pimeloyl-ACP methyl ester carboxylesterase
MGHGLGAVKEMRLGAYAERFAAGGYACLLFDYRHFGGSDGRPRQLLSVPEQLADWEAAIAFARALPGIDPDRVVAFGSSFGGGHALSVAARDHRLAAAIAQCPFTDGLASTLAIPPLTSAKVVAAAVCDLAAAARSREPVYLPGSATPGITAFMTAPDALPGMQALAVDAPAFDNRLTARSAFDILRYAPGRHAADISCPVFAALCAHDSVAPARKALGQISRAPLAQIKVYPIGHFDIYLGDAFEQAVADYLAFLAEHVPVDA